MMTTISIRTRKMKRANGRMSPTWTKTCWMTPSPAPCKKPIHEQSEFCPHCGNYVSEEDSPSRKSLWIIVGVAACVLVIVIFWVR